MTQQEQQEVVRVCGPNHEETDIPAFIRNRDFNEEMSQAEAEDRMIEEFGDEVKLDERGREVETILRKRLKPINN